MKIINLKTNIIFNLPDSDAKQLLNVAPDTFAKIGKNNKIIKSNIQQNSESVLSKILDD